MRLEVAALTDPGNPVGPSGLAVNLVRGVGRGHIGPEGTRFQAVFVQLEDFRPVFVAYRPSIT